MAERHKMAWWKELVFNAARKILQSDLPKLLSPSYLTLPQPVLSSTKSFKQLCDAYQSWTYIAIDKIAKNIAVLPMSIYYYRKNGKAVSANWISEKLRAMENKGEVAKWMKADNITIENVGEHPFIDLMHKPNPLMTRYSLWYHIIVRLELTGACGLYLSRDKLSIPREIWPLPLTESGVLKARTSSLTGLDGWDYQDGPNSAQYTIDQCKVIFYPNPKSPFEGKSPVLAQVYPYDIDNFLMQQEYYLLKNRSIFGNVFTTEQRLNEKQVEELKELITAQYAGAVNTGLPLFLHSGLNITDKNLMQNPDQSSAAERAREKLITTHDLTEGHLGLVDTTNRATAETHKMTFIDECLRPKTLLLESFINSQILPIYDERLTVKFELPPTDDKEYQLKERESNLDRYVTTINEERAKMGLQPVPWGDKPWATYSTVPLGASITVDNNDKIDDEESTDSKIDDDESTNSKIDDEKSTNISNKKPVEISVEIKAFTEDWKVAYWKDFASATVEWEGAFINAVIGIFAAQRAEVIEKLNTNGNKFAEMITGWGMGKVLRLIDTKDPTAMINIDKKKWIEKTKEIIAPVYLYVIEKAGNRRMRFLAGGNYNGLKANINKPEFAFNINDPRVKKYLGERLEKFSMEVTNTTFDEIKKTLRYGFAEGKPIPVISQELSETFGLFDKYRAPLIARTETISASNKADIEAVGQSGLAPLLKKHWLSSRDGAARQTHLDADAAYDQEGGIDVWDDFFVGDDRMSAPGGGNIAEENINCRCTVYYTEKE